MTKSSTGLLLVVLKSKHSLGIIDPESQAKIADIPVGGVTGHEAAASPDGKTAYVPVYGNSGVGKPGTDGQNVAVIDIATHKLVKSVDFGAGVRPHCAVFNPKTGELYVTTELRQSVSIIDPKTLKIVGSIPTGQPESHMLAVSHDGKRGYTANVGPGTVSVLDLEARKTLKIIPISGETQRISISRDDSMVFTSDQKEPKLVVIDTASNEVKTRITLPGLGYGTAITPDGRWLLIAVPATNQVTVVDLQTLKVAHNLDVPSAPQEVLVRPDNQKAYVSCVNAGKVGVIDLKTWTVDKPIDAGEGSGTDGLAWGITIKRSGSCRFGSLP